MIRPYAGSIHTCRRRLVYIHVVVRSKRSRGNMESCCTIPVAVVQQQQLESVCKVQGPPWREGIGFVSFFRVF